MPSPWTFSVAPMMDWTDSLCRQVHRLMSRHALLYTEMVTTGAVIHGDRKRLIGFRAEEQPVAVQLGGCDPAALAQAARICADEGYAEINLNVGCPSDRVKSGSFGACLMREPQLVGDGLAAMKAAVAVPVTVKCRIGVDDQDPEQALDELADAVVAAGCDALIVHARKAWLKGLSPKENRDIPPLDYARVYRLKQRLPGLPVAINGGIRTLDEARAHLAHVDGAMLGRAAYQNPELLMGVDPLLFGQPAPFTDPREVMVALEPVIARHLEEGGRLHHVTRHLAGFFPGRPGARIFRQHLAGPCQSRDAGLDTFRAALACLDRAPRRDEPKSSAA